MAGNKNSGRRPLPRAVKEARGTTRPDRDGEPEEQVDFGTPEPGKTPPPDWLDATARKEWRIVVPLLEKARVLSAADYGQLANYCAAQGNAIKGQRRINREGLTVKRANGSLAAHPLLSVVKEARAQALRIAIEFGITPAARTRIGAVDGEDPIIPDAPSNGPQTTAERHFFGGKPTVQAPKPPAPLQLVAVSEPAKAEGEKS